MTPLDRAYREWRERPLPRGSSNDELAALHADLVLVDTWVAEAVIPFVERTQYVFSAVDVPAGIRVIRERAQELAPYCDGEDAGLAAEYIAYADRLDAVYRQFERTVSEAGLSN